jgi:hypothetical protein
MAKETAVLTSAYEAEVRVVALVRDHESAAGCEVARARNYVSYCGGAPERQQGQNQPT